MFVFPAFLLLVLFLAVGPTLAAVYLAVTLNSRRT